MNSWHIDPLKGNDLAIGNAERPLLTEVEFRKRAAMYPYLCGAHVYDLGCGAQFKHAERLLSCNPASLTGVDHAVPEGPFDDRVMYSPWSFDAFVPPNGRWVAYVSWPAANPTRVHTLLDGSRGTPPTCVIYRGCCSDGTMCGDPEFWQEVRNRQVLEHIQSRPETLTVYGTARVRRPPLPDEYAALEQPNRVLMYDELLVAVAKVT